MNLYTESRPCVNPVAVRVDAGWECQVLTTTAIAASRHSSCYTRICTWHTCLRLLLYVSRLKRIIHMRTEDAATRKRSLVAEMVATRASIVADTRRISLALAAARALLIRRSVPVALAAVMAVPVWKVLAILNKRGRRRVSIVRARSPKIETALSVMAKVALLMRVLRTAGRVYSVLKPKGAPSALEHLQSLAARAARSVRLKKSRHSASSAKSSF